MKRKPGVLDVLTGLVLMAAVYLLARPGSAAYEGVRGWFSRRSHSQMLEREWPRLATIAMPLFAGTEPPEVIEFLDNQCPYCREISPSVDSALSQGVRISVVHLPLSIHRNARAAARLAICTSRSGRFVETHKKLLASADWHTDSLLLTRSLEQKAETFACDATSADDSTLAKHLALAELLKVQSTPTFFARGRVLDGRPDAGRL